MGSRGQRLAPTLPASHFCDYEIAKSLSCFGAIFVSLCSFEPVDTAMTRFFKISRFLVCLIAAATLFGCDTRVDSFEEFILNRADSLAYAKCNDEELQRWIDSYEKRPGLFDVWMEDVKHSQKTIRKNLRKHLGVINDLDAKYARTLPFDEALQIILAQPDTASPDKVILLKREILALYDRTENIIIWEEAQKWAKEKEMHRP